FQVVRNPEAEKSRSSQSGPSGAPRIPLAASSPIDDVVGAPVVLLSRLSKCDIPNGRQLMISSLLVPVIDLDDDAALHQSDDVQYVAARGRRREQSWVVTLKCVRPGRPDWSVRR